MERLIKFRGKDLKGKWHYGDLVHLGEGYIIIEETKLGEPTKPDECEFALGYHEDEFAVVVPDTIGQFTGIYDKFGTEIYEGDILWWRCEDEPEIETRGMVYYEDAAFRVKLEVWQNGEPLYSYGSRSLADVYENDGLRVIGNVFDNPELFETKDGYYGKINQNK